MICSTTEELWIGYLSKDEGCFVPSTRMVRLAREINDPLARRKGGSYLLTVEEHRTEDNTYVLVNVYHGLIVYNILERTSEWRHAHTGKVEAQDKDPRLAIRGYVR